MVMGNEGEVQQKEKEGKEVDQESYEERHRRRTRRSMQQYPSSPELGEEVYHGKGKARKFMSI